MYTRRVLRSRVLPYCHVCSKRVHLGLILARKDLQAAAGSGPFRCKRLALSHMQYLRCLKITDRQYPLRYVPVNQTWLVLAHRQLFVVQGSAKVMLHRRTKPCHAHERCSSRAAPDHAECCATISAMAIEQPCSNMLQERLDPYRHSQMHVSLAAEHMYMLLQTVLLVVHQKSRRHSAVQLVKPVGSQRTSLPQFVAVACHHFSRPCLHLLAMVPDARAHTTLLKVTVQGYSPSAAHTRPSSHPGKQCQRAAQ